MISIPLDKSTITSHGEGNSEILINNQETGLYHLNYTFSYPIHLRYQKPSDEDYKEVFFNRHPSVYLSTCNSENEEIEENRFKPFEIEWIQDRYP
jgi:hypothetical protein